MKGGEEEAMDKETRKRVRDTVLELLQSADLDVTTELEIRKAASDCLGINLHLPTQKVFVRKIVEAFIVSVADAPDEKPDVQETENPTLKRKPDVQETENPTLKRKPDVQETENPKLKRKSDVQETEGPTLKGKSDVQETENQISEDEPSKMRELKKDGRMPDDDDSVICNLSKNRKVSIQEFRGMKLVSIREFYEKNGVQLPSNKGISLTSEQWAILRKATSKIEAAVARLR